MPQKESIKGGWFNMSDFTTKRENNQSIKKEKIRMESISFTDGESDGIPLVTTTVYTWQDANKFILQRALTKENLLGYSKTFFEVKFEDGNIYKGRYDIRHFSKEKADLKKHIIDFALCYSGRKRPPSFETEQEYKVYLNFFGKEEMQNYATLLDEYELLPQKRPIIERESFKDLLIKTLKQVENLKLFDYGKISFTLQIYRKAERDPTFCQFILNSLQKHLLGNFGVIPEEDFKESLYSLEHDLRIISSYSFNDIKIWIITDADRLRTTVLFPEEY